VTTSLTVGEAGAGRPFVLLHGGAGPASMRDFADRLAETYPAHPLAPIHPGFALTDRPERLASIAGLAHLYAAWLDQVGLEDVVLVGNSIGGWIAAESLSSSRGVSPGWS
jgi:pimeloyl-ACP methyl ester carboxylesterase